LRRGKIVGVLMGPRIRAIRRRLLEPLNHRPFELSLFARRHNLGYPEHGKYRGGEQPNQRAKPEPSASGRLRHPTAPLIKPHPEIAGQGRRQEES